MQQATYPDLEGKVALVTGGASGLGLAVASALVAQGVRVYIADLNEPAAKQAASELSNATALHLDVTSPESWAQTMAAVSSASGRLDVLVNSAGIIRIGDIETASLADWQAVMRVNLDGVFLGCKHGVGLMKHTGGSIINLSSVSGIVGGYNLAAYNASKGGVRLLTKSVALHCARKGYGIRCNSVHPSFVDTPMADAVIEASANPEKTRAALTAQVPMGRFAKAEEVAALVLYLASPASSFVTGAEFVIDGGLTAQ